MSQTAYSQAIALGRAGMLADNTNRDVVSRNAYATVIPFGVGVVQGAADNECKVPAAASDITSQGSLLGLALVDLSLQSQYNVGTQTVAQYLQNQMVAILKKGRAWVTVEEAVTPTSSVFMRFANGVADATQVQKGAFRASADASGSTAQVATLTPTAVNATIYAVEILNAAGAVIAAAEYLSDSSATATEIVTGLKAALGTVAGITQSGTTTLILTASTAGVAFTVNSIGDGTIAVAATTANVTGTATAAQVTNARYVTTQATIGGLAVVEFNLP